MAGLVYAGQEMVGFTMYWYDEKNGRGHIDRLMVDEHHQAKGYGTAATVEVIKRLAGHWSCRSIQTSFAHANAVAERVYTRLEFRRTGDTTNCGEEAIVVLDVK